MQRDEFVRKYAGIYEHSPWVAEFAFEAGGDIATAMRAAVDGASVEKKLKLICNHPDLACAPAVRLTAASVSEQRGAGLKECTPEEFAEFQQLNANYKKKFGFPFIVAVRGMHREDILKQFRQRINNDKETEFRTAIEQIHKIAKFRLDAIHL